MAMNVERTDAVADLIGALCYGLLRSFQVVAAGTMGAPTVALAERQAAFAADEHGRYRILRERLAELTEEPFETMKTFRPTMDAYYDGARAQDWLQTQVFHFVGDTITTDFAEILAPRLDARTADAVRRALTGRTAQETFALEQITEALREHGAQERIASFAGRMAGEALNRLREALLSSDALEVVLGGQEGVKELVLEVLGRHRERLERLGLDPLGD